MFAHAPAAIDVKYRTIGAGGYIITPAVKYLVKGLALPGLQAPQKVFHASMDLSKTSTSSRVQTSPRSS